jgi:hypothetical protein
MQENEGMKGNEGRKEMKEGRKDGRNVRIIPVQQRQENFLQRDPLG